MAPSFKLLIDLETGKKYLVKKTREDFHTSQGKISYQDLKANKPEIKTNQGKKFLLLPPSFVDLWEKIKRGPQILLQKDIGLIITKTGLNKTSRVLDAGGGSGSLCCYLALICKEVITYEKERKLVALLRENKKFFNLKNLKIKNKDIYQGIKEKNLDLITLDLSEPWRVLPSAASSLKRGGFLVVYLPNLLQVKIFVDSLLGTPFQLLEIKELLERTWKVTSQIMRPEFTMLGHTGFLIFSRKFFEQ